MRNGVYNNRIQYRERWDIMEELYDLLNHLLENEYDLNALLYILDRVQEGYDEEEDRDLKYQVSMIKEYLKRVSEGLRRSIDELDVLLATGNFRDI